MAAPASADMPAEMPLNPLSEINRLERSISRFISFTSCNESECGFCSFIKSTLKYKVSSKKAKFQNISAFILTFMVEAYPF